MEISDKDIQSYKTLIKEEYNIEISHEEAMRQSTALINLLRFSQFPNSFDYGN